jgi:hypothetical protein
VFLSRVGKRCLTALLAMLLVPECETSGPSLAGKNTMVPGNRWLTVRVEPYYCVSSRTHTLTGHKICTSRASTICCFNISGCKHHTNNSDCQFFDMTWWAIHKSSSFIPFLQVTFIKNYKQVFRDAASTPRSVWGDGPCQVTNRARPHACRRSVSQQKGYHNRLWDFAGIWSCRSAGTT